MILVPLYVCVFKKLDEPCDWEYLLWTDAGLIPGIPEELETEEEM